MFAHVSAKQLWSIVYSRYVPLQILNYCETLTHAQGMGNRFTAKSPITIRYGLRGPYTSDSVRGGIAPSHLHTVSQ